jgi:membrane protease YdiL (CAAX protease family)
VLNPLDHVLLVVLAVLFPLRAARFGIRRLRLAAPEERPRLRLVVYREAMVIQWSLVAATLVLWWALGRPWEALGVVPRIHVGTLAMAVLLAGALIGGLVQTRRALLDDASLERTVERVRHLEAMLPHGPRELRAFQALAITAGACEELLYRGYLIWYFGAWMGPWVAAAASSVVFGIGHLYQGWRGILSTAAVGALFAALYLVSGSLFLPMVAHALVDLHAGHVTHAAFARQAARAEAIAIDESRVLAEALRDAEALEAAEAREAGSPDEGAAGGRT